MQKIKINSFSQKIKKSVALIGLISLAACSSVVPPNGMDNPNDKIPTFNKHSSKLVSDWAQTYQGFIKTKDGKKMDVIVDLLDNGNYILQTQEVGSKKINIQKGLFNFERSGQAIKLEGARLKYFLVGQNVLGYLKDPYKLKFDAENQLIAIKFR